MNGGAICQEREQKRMMRYHLLSLSCLWDMEMKISSKQLDGQMLSFEEKLGIDSYSIQKGKIE